MYHHDVNNVHEFRALAVPTSPLQMKYLSPSEGDIVIASVRPSIMLSPPKPLDEIKPNLVCELLT